MLQRIVVLIVAGINDVNVFKIDCRHCDCILDVPVDIVAIVLHYNLLPIFASVCVLYVFLIETG